jgi:hypothetical protein
MGIFLDVVDVDAGRAVTAYNTKPIAPGDANFTNIHVLLDHVVFLGRAIFGRREPISWLGSLIVCRDDLVDDQMPGSSAANVVFVAGQSNAVGWNETAPTVTSPLRDVQAQRSGPAGHGNTWSTVRTTGRTTLREESAVRAGLAAFAQGTAFAALDDAVAPACFVFLLNAIPRLAFRVERPFDTILREAMPMYRAGVVEDDRVLLARRDPKRPTDHLAI